MPTLRNGKSTATESSAANGHTKHASDKEQLVILGSGWAGYAVMQKVDRSRYHVTMSASRWSFPDIRSLGRGHRLICSLFLLPRSQPCRVLCLHTAPVGSCRWYQRLQQRRRAGAAVSRSGPSVFRKSGLLRQVLILFACTQEYHQAYARKVDFKRKTIECSPAIGSEIRKQELNRRIDDDSDDAIKPAVSYPGQKLYTIDYDKLIIAVGCGTATFGIEGAEAHSFMLKTADDAQKIRTRILECFEIASQPTLTAKERKDILHFAVVGGGPTGKLTSGRLVVFVARALTLPTGVEFAGELHDFLTGDLEKAYPSLRPLAQMYAESVAHKTDWRLTLPFYSTIYDVAPGVLQGFDKSLSEFAAEKFKRQGVAIKCESHITRVCEDHLEIEEEGDVPFGMLVWNTGLAANPFIDSIKDLKKDEKTHVCVLLPPPTLRSELISLSKPADHKPPQCHDREGRGLRRRLLPRRLQRVGEKGAAYRPECVLSS